MKQREQNSLNFNVTFVKSLSIRMGRDESSTNNSFLSSTSFATSQYRMGSIFLVLSRIKAVCAVN